MCLSAIYWANIRTLYYIAGRDVAEKIGFMDRHLYSEIALPMEEREMKSVRIISGDMDRLLEEWKDMEGRFLY